MNSKSFADPLNKNDKNITADGPPNPADGSPNPVDGQPNPADGQSKPVNGQLSPADEKPSLADALERLDKPALISIILQYANQHRPMKDMLLLQLSERISAADYAGRLVKASIQNAAKRGFVEAACVGDAIEGARIAGDLAAAKYRDGRFFDCAGIYAAMLGETVALLAYCDDSGGRVTGIIDETMERLEALLAAIPPGHPDTGKIF
ncbi:MAG: hypothetical protein LBK98_03385, partial [Peptococcaceae bacterium]|nr:hypothetical protein [Peptococcaceae bacterium]